MIQRIQTIYLLLVLISSISLYFLPFSTFSHSESGTSFLHIFSVTGHKTYEGDILKTSQPFYPVLLINIILSVVSLIAIMMYKKRQLQMRMCRVLLIIVVGLVVMIFNQSSRISEAGDQIIYHAGTYVMIITMLWVFLALRAIKHDEDLVRASDRLR
jgi:cytochrome c biogenesis factor